MLHKKSTQGWRTIADRKFFFRSLWESNYARWLQFQKERKLIKDWEHETETFWFEKIKRGVRSYLPDFKIINNDDSIHYAEVKGYYDSKSITKIKRFKLYYPQHKIILIDSKWFKLNSIKLRSVIHDWEVGQNVL